MKDRILIFLADDDAAMRQMLASSLRSQGYQVDECEDGAQLLRRLQASQTGRPCPRLVISDVQMPGATGLDVLHWLQRWLPSVPTILITAFGDARTHERANELGATLVLDKPFDLARLTESANRLLQQHASAAGPSE